MSGILVFMSVKHFAQAKVTVRKQISIPKKVQDALGGVETGDYVLFSEDRSRIYIEKGHILPKGK